MVALFALLAALEGDLDHLRLEHLGMNVHAANGQLVVGRVVIDGPAARAGVRVGARIIAVRGVEVTTLAQLERLLHPSRGVLAFELTIEDDRPPATGPRFRLALLAVGHQFTTTEGVRSAWVGIYGAYALGPSLWGIGGFGYIAVGPRPGFGKDGFSPMAGVEYEMKLPFTWLTTFARAMVGVNLARGPGIIGAAGRIVPVSALAHLGVRLGGIFEVSAAGGLGPGEGFNAGMAAAIGVTSDAF